MQAQAASRYSYRPAITRCRDSRKRCRYKWSSRPWAPSISLESLSRPSLAGDTYHPPSTPARKSRPHSSACLRGCGRRIISNSPAGDRHPPCVLPNASNPRQSDPRSPSSDSNPPPPVIPRSMRAARRAPDGTQASLYPSARCSRPPPTRHQCDTEQIRQWTARVLHPTLRLHGRPSSAFQKCPAPTPRLPEKTGASSTSPAREVFKYKQTRLAAHGQIQVAVAIEIRHADLHARADAASVIDHMFDPFDGAVFRRTVFVPINSQRLAFARVGSIVRHIPLASHEIGASIAVQIHHGHRVRLRPRVVNHVLLPLAGTQILHPEHAVIVAHRCDQIVSSIAVDVEYVDVTDAHQIELGMKFPIAAAWISGRLEPSKRSHDVVPSIAVDIAHSDAVPVAARTDDVFHKSSVDQFEPRQGVLHLVAAPLRKQLLRLAVAIDVHQERELDAMSVFDQMLFPRTPLLAGVLIPPKLVGVRCRTHHVRIPIAIHVDQQVAQILGRVAKVFNGAKLVLRPVGPFVPVLSRNDIGMPVAIDVADGARFIGARIDHVTDKRNLFGPGRSQRKECRHTHSGRNADGHRFSHPKEDMTWGKKSEL